MPRPQAVQKADGKSSRELYTACTAAPIASCTKHVAHEDDAGCVLPPLSLGCRNRWKMQPLAQPKPLGPRRKAGLAVPVRR